MGPEHGRCSCVLMVRCVWVKSAAQKLGCPVFKSHLCHFLNQ